jgi:hypothetical protein
MNYNGFNKKDKKSKDLNHYFTQARLEKIDFTSSEAKKMIAKHAVAVGALGLIAKFIYNIGWKNLTMMSAALITTSVVTYSVITNNENDKNLQTSHTQKNYVEQSQKVATSNTDRIQKIKSDAVSHANENNPEDQDVSNSKNSDSVGERNLTANKSVLPSYRSSIASKTTEKTKYPKDDNINAIDAQDEKTIISKPEQYAPEAVSEYDYPQLFLVDIDNRIVASLEQVTSEPIPYYTPEEIPPYDNNQLRTLFDDFSKHNSYWISYDQRWGKIQGIQRAVSGGKIGWTMNRQLTIGLAGYSLVADDDIDFLNIDNSAAKGTYSMGYGGIFLEYTFRPTDLIHFSANSFVGFGGNTLVSKNAPTNPWSAFVVFEPGVAAEINIIKWIKCGASANYRLASTFAQNDVYKANDNLTSIGHDGFSYGFYIKIGFF